jgi:hypothetical protein
MPQREPIDPAKYYFSTLMNDIESGRVRLPPFQRKRQRNYTVDERLDWCPQSRLRPGQ